MNVRNCLQQLLAFGFMVVAVYGRLVTKESSSYQLPGLSPPKNPHVRVLDIDSWTDWIWATLYTGIFYVCKYYSLSSWLESNNPTPKTEYRVQMGEKQKWMGIKALLWVILATTLWMWKVEPHLPYYGFYEHNDLTLFRLVASIGVYLFVFDTWFYLTHLIMHHPLLMKHVHRFHHEFREPVAFGQDAVHPLEGIVQGPLGHFMSSFFYPIHPIVSVVMGFLTSIWAICAHDGRFDPNDHQKHHQYIDCNYGIYWGFWDFIFGKRYSKQRFPIDYVWSYEKEQAKFTTDPKKTK